MFGNYIKLAGILLAIGLVLFVFFSAWACAPKEPVKYLALAFDDGPNLTTESKMLDVLAKHNVPATFFVVGKNINEESAENLKRALEFARQQPRLAFAALHGNVPIILREKQYQHTA